MGGFFPSGLGCLAAACWTAASSSFNGVEPIPLDESEHLPQHCRHAAELPEEAGAQRRSSGTAGAAVIGDGTGQKLERASRPAQLCRRPRPRPAVGESCRLHPKLSSMTGRDRLYRDQSRQLQPSTWRSEAPAAYPALTHPAVPCGPAAGQCRSTDGTGKLRVGDARRVRARCVTTAVAAAVPPIPPRPAVTNGFRDRDDLVASAATRSIQPRLVQCAAPAPASIPQPAPSSRDYVGPRCSRPAARSPRIRT